ERPALQLPLERPVARADEGLGVGDVGEVPQHQRALLRLPPRAPRRRHRRQPLAEAHVVSNPQRLRTRTSTAWKMTRSMTKPMTTMATITAITRATSR